MAREKVSVGDLSSLVEPVIMIGALYFLYTKFFGPGATSGGANNLATEDASKTAAAADLAKSTAAGQTQVLSNNTLNGYATDLQNMISNFSGDDLTMSNIVSTASQVDTQGDWDKLVSLFGTRKFNSSLSFYSWCNLTGYNCTSMDLPSALALILDQAHKTALNSYFTMQGINASI